MLSAEIDVDQVFGISWSKTPALMTSEWESINVVAYLNAICRPYIQVRSCVGFFLEF